MDNDVNYPSCWGVDGQTGFGFLPATSVVVSYGHIKSVQTGIRKILDSMSLIEIRFPVGQQSRVFNRPDFAACH